MPRLSAVGISRLQVGEDVNTDKESRMSHLDPNKEERDAVPVFVRNAVQCRICGAPADRHGSIFQCQKTPGHIADTMTGIFSDLSWPSRVEKK